MIFRKYLHELFKFSPVRLITSLVMMIFLGMTQGAGLLTLIPFLNLAGLIDPERTGSKLVVLTGNLFKRVNLPFTLPYALILFILVISFNAVLVSYQSIFNTRLQQGFIRHLRNRIYSLAVRSEWNYILKKKSSDITNILTTEINSIRYITIQFLSLSSSIFIITAHIIMALMVSVPMSILVVATASLLSMTYLPWNRKVSETGKAGLQWRKKMFFHISEHLNGMKISKSYGKERDNIKRFEKLCRGIEAETINLYIISARSQVVYRIGSVIALSLFVYIGIELIQVQVGELLLLVFIFSRLLPMFSRLQGGIQQIIYQLPGLKSVMDFEEESACNAEQHISEDNSGHPVQLNRNITLKNVDFLYNPSEDKYAIRNLSFSFKANQTTAIIGSSGAGKSTLADLIMGLLTPEQGVITIDNQRLDGSLLRRWRNSVGYVPQETFLFNDTIRANLLWANPRANEDDLWEALKITRSQKFVELLPHKLDTVVGERGVQLSGGERQRIALARALVRKPTLLLMDEATNSLDTANEKLIQEAINKLHGKLTIIIIAHRFSTIRGADRIIVMDKGRIVEAGSWDQLSFTGD